MADEFSESKDEVIRRLGLIGDGDITKVFKYASDNKTWDILNEVWINALLSNPKTHIINTTSISKYTVRVSHTVIYHIIKF